MDNQNQKEHIDVYAMVTNRIIELLEQGTIPWQQPWTDSGQPRNLITKRPYKGVNILLLNSLSFEHNLFLTFKQIKTIGGSVIKGEKGQFIVFTKMVDDKDDPSKKRYFLRFYKVFNYSQCTGIPIEFLPSENSTCEKVSSFEVVAENMPNPPKITVGGKEAFYSPSEDRVNMPPIKTFKQAHAYYSVLFHELVHSTGHQSRLNRKEVTEKIVFGSQQYSLEELVAEIGSCYLKSYTGIFEAEIVNSVSYINHWLEKLKNDKKFIIHAASRAQRAVEYIINDKQMESQNTDYENQPELEEESF